MVDHNTHMMYTNVIMGENVQIHPFVIVGEPPRDYQPGELETRIGNQAVLRSHTVIYAGNMIGDNFQTGHGVLVRETNRIGNHVSIGSHSVIEHHITIGHHVRIHSNVFIPEFSTLEEDCWVGPCVTFTNAQYPRSRSVKDELRGPHIKRGARIGAGAVLLPGVVIGEYALIGAGAVVVDNVPDGAVVVGNPARYIKHIDSIAAYAELTDQE